MNADALVAVLTLDDNPAFEGLFEFCSISAGGSIGAFVCFGVHVINA